MFFSVNGPRSKQATLLRGTFFSSPGRKATLEARKAKSSSNRGSDGLDPVLLIPQDVPVGPRQVHEARLVAVGFIAEGTAADVGGGERQCWKRRRKNHPQIAARKFA